MQKNPPPRLEEPAPALAAACRALGSAVAAEAQARRRRNEAEMAIDQEADRAARSADDADVERFAAQLPAARRRLAAAEAALAEAIDDTARRRVQVRLARSAALARQRGAVDQTDA